jgi:hypothetical protein
VQPFMAMTPKSPNSYCDYLYPNGVYCNLLAPYCFAGETYYCEQHKESDQHLA